MNTYLYLSIAFDTLNYAILIDKLSCYGKHYNKHHCATLIQQLNTK